MLHPVKPVTCLPEMNKLLQFQRGVLELGIAIAKGAVNNDEAGFKKILGDDSVNDVGQWFWKVYNRNQEWRNGMTDFIAACTSELFFIDKILPAFDHDVVFHDHLTDINYNFKFPMLEDSIKISVKKLLKAFYSYLVGTGYPDMVHGKADFVLTRAEFVYSYESAEANGKMNVCPICDKEISDNDFVNDISVCELDHFFPVSVYPFLSVHPYNLIPTCHECNSPLNKGGNDPLNNDDKNPSSSGTFPNTYHPHKNRSIRDLGRILLSRGTSENGPFEVDIEDIQELPHCRINSAQRVYNLPKRWAKRFNNPSTGIEEILTRVRHQAKFRAKQPLTIEQMLWDIKNDLKISTNAHHTILQAYLEFAMNNTKEQEFLYREYMTAPHFGQ